MVLLALGVILPGAVIFWQLSERQRVTTEQVDAQQQSRDALVGFLHANYRLPCPAADTLGVEDCSAATRQVGFLPWRTLDLPRPAAGGLRYGVHRAPSAAGAATAPLDQDLTVARDRMNPLRVRTPDPTPNNANAPNPNAPPIPTVAAGLLGVTQSGIAAAPLNAACDAADEPPCPLGVANAVNLLDVCLALNTASDAVLAPAGRLASQVGASRRAAAFVIATPGLLDANGDGQAFDGANATANDANPTFEAPSRAVSDTYDDIVLAASHTELFAELHCAAALSAVSHAHVNVATGALVMERGMYDYRDQLYIAVVLARADVAAAAAGALSAVAGGLDAAKEMISATADTTLSLGARSFQIGLAAVGIGLAVASGVAAALSVTDAALSLVEAEDVHADFAARTTAMTTLSRSVNVNVLTADAIGH
jgi:hypothetical protein